VWEPTEQEPTEQEPTEEEPIEQERREVYYQGMVQGVGFRYTTRRIAARFAVTGYVQNLPDGRVFLLAEGPPQELDGFLKAVAGAMGHFIRHTEERARPASGRFQQFHIR